MSKTSLSLPNPIISKKEEELLEKYQKRYENMIKPNKFAVAGGKIADQVPDKIKLQAKNIKNEISEAELMKQCLKVVANGFGTLEKYAANATVSEKTIVNKIGKTTKLNSITSLDEICLARSYNIAKIVQTYKKQDISIAALEGSATGFFGFPGLPFNIVLSTFIYFRAVQSIAMFYGYDVRNDASELEIASEVFISAMSPKSKGANEAAELIGKIMIMAELNAVKQTVKKTWAEMAERGGICLLIVQLRALANKAAKKALENAGKKGLEKSAFTEVLRQLGTRLTKDTVGKSIPLVGAVVGGLFDVMQMNTILEFADIFYHKRFLIEKEVRIEQLIESRNLTV